MPDVTITVDGKKLTAPGGTLLIEACKRVGIEVPAFCYYPGLSLQAACRMCLVEIEKMPKLQTACTVPITDGMVVTTESEKVKQARKSMLELVLGNHPLDCPVCDAGGECELQDMTFKYGAADSRYMEGKLHKDEQQWSPVVFFDRPRCILCYRCVRVCGEGMDVWALGVQGRGVSSVIAPNQEDHLECEECGMCIDICPVGALTSGAYRYKTRPWEMKHVGTICTHCGDGCKTTLGVRRHDTGMQIVRGDNRDKSGINGDFLCIKGRYAFDFTDHRARITQPLVRKDGHLRPASWEEALEVVAHEFRDVRESKGGAAIGVIGSTRTTNEENYLLQKFARLVLQTNNIDHHRTADFPALAAALKGKDGATAGMRDVFSAPAMLLIGNDPTDQHPLLAWQIRSNVRLHKARLYLANTQPIKLRRQAAVFAHIADGGYAALLKFLAGDDSATATLLRDGTPRETLIALRDKIKAEPDLIIMFGAEIKGADVQALAAFAASLPKARLIALADYANSRGASDMGLYPDLLPGYTASADHFAREWDAQLPAQPGMSLAQMTKAAADGRLKAMYVVGSNPVARFDFDPFVLTKPFLVVQDMFLTNTAAIADVVLPVACAYEKSGTFTNSAGDLQQVQKAGDLAGVKPDFEIIVRIAERMGFDVRKLVPFGREGVRADMGQSRGAQSGEADRHYVWLKAQNLEPKMSPLDPQALFDEIQRVVPGYQISRAALFSGTEVRTHALTAGNGGTSAGTDLIRSSNDTLFTSGTLGRYSHALNSVMENRRRAPAGAAAD
ncbi:MAG: NADH-quinone oxidoreductase subunit NuoG [Candidatus Koribacter versatilis]|uniref:NADH-quinone oxidoreductase subunit NuoG n=1 Tax=Candidatus Korobacter versatilis TaxID=658062 RepID=A0A932A7A3_9BACT|nr:NADH-quinone oxidoreductase subunit NuoG [Candidatus Koribacter versatilis]